MAGRRKPITAIPEGTRDADRVAGPFTKGEAVWRWRELLDAMGTVSAVAKRLNRSERTIYAYKAGKREPGPEVRREILRATGVDAGWAYGLAVEEEVRRQERQPQTPIAFRTQIVTRRRARFAREAGATQAAMKAAGQAEDCEGTTRPVLGIRLDGVSEQAITAWRRLSPKEQKASAAQGNGIVDTLRKIRSSPTAKATARSAADGGPIRERVHRLDGQRAKAYVADIWRELNDPGRGLDPSNDPGPGLEDADLRRQCAERSRQEWEAEKAAKTAVTPAL